MGKLDDVLAKIQAHANASNQGPEAEPRPTGHTTEVAPAADLAVHPSSGQSIPIAPSKSELAETVLDAPAVAPVAAGAAVPEQRSRRSATVQVTAHSDLKGVMRQVQHFNWHPNIEVCRSQTNAAEEVKKMRTNIVNLMDRQGIHSFMVTSCKHAEGKSTTALALARSLADLAGRSVCLVDADMRRPRVKNFLDIKVEKGLDDVVLGEADLAEVLVHSIDDGLTVAPTRKGRSIASEMLGSERMISVVETLSKNFDIVIFDSPPCLSTTDPIILGGLVDAVSLVVKMNHTPRHSVEHSISLMRQSQVPFVGLILTHHVVHYNTYLLQRYNYYQDYYGYYAYQDEANEGDNSS